MNLEITNYSNQFKIKGILNRQNVAVFAKEFKDIFDKFNSLILNIEGLTSIDRYGVNALAQLHNESLSRRKCLSIIGMGWDDFQVSFKSEETAA